MRFNQRLSSALQCVMSTALAGQLSWPEAQVKESETEDVNTDLGAEGKHSRDGLAGGLGKGAGNTTDLA